MKSKSLTLGLAIALIASSTVASAAVLFPTQPARFWTTIQIAKIRGWTNSADGGSFVITPVAGSALDSCPSSLIYVDRTKIGAKHADNMYAAALAAMMAQVPFEVAVDNPTVGGNCSVGGMAYGVIAPPPQS